jgi:hypothetical protein
MTNDQCFPLLWLLNVGLILGCSTADPLADTAPRQVAATPSALADATDRSPAAPFRFVDVAEARGIRFPHWSPLTEQRHLHLVMGSGVGWFDFDRDGWADLYCCQGASHEGAVDRDESARTNTFYQNRGGDTFSDVTRHASLLDTRYSMGIGAADYDNDGFVDLCVTGYGANTLLHNNGDGTFTRVELPESVPGALSASCTWGDVDADGNLDLLITNYARLDPEDYPLCDHTADGKTIHIACHPSQLDRLPDLLYRNSGTGQFADFTDAAGIDGAGLQGLGSISADLDQDGDMDFFVANDSTPNHLWENLGEGRFTDRGADSGTATNRYGEREAGMGVAVGDVDGNGLLDLFLTHFYHESNTLYRNEGGLLFTDVTDEMGLGAPSRPRLAFGASLADFDNDGWLDLLVANGHIHDRLVEIGRDQPFAQLPQAFRNDGGTRFLDVSAACGDYFRETHLGRGMAVADYDRNGRMNVAINHLNGELALLHNTADVGHWLRVELIGTRTNRDGVGAWLQIDLGDRVLVRGVQAGGSYLSCDERAIVVGMGQHDHAAEVTVVWPGGRRESWTSLSANRLWQLTEGTGRP